MMLFPTTAVCSRQLMVTAFSPNAGADEAKKKTAIDFSGPAEISGVHFAGFGTMPAGIYGVKILESTSDRHIVQIFNREETIVYATVLAIPNYRLRTADQTLTAFRERPAGEPEALRAWFYPGDNHGRELVCGKAKAMRRLS